MTSFTPEILDLVVLYRCSLRIPKHSTHIWTTTSQTTHRRHHRSGRLLLTGEWHHNLTWEELYRTKVVLSSISSSTARHLGSIIIIMVCLYFCCSWWWQPIVSTPVECMAMMAISVTVLFCLFWLFLCGLCEPVSSRELEIIGFAIRNRLNFRECIGLTFLVGFSEDHFSRWQKIVRRFLLISKRIPSWKWYEGALSESRLYCLLFSDLVWRFCYQQKNVHWSRLYKIFMNKQVDSENFCEAGWHVWFRARCETLLFEYVSKLKKILQLK